MVRAERKYVDLIRQSTLGLFANWDPENPIKVGSYGRFDLDTSRFTVLGNIYDPEFQVLLDAVHGNFKMSDYPPELDPVEQDMIVTSTGARKHLFDPGPNAKKENFKRASFKMNFKFLSGKRSAVLIMHKPRLQHIPRNKVLDVLYRIPEFNGLFIVPSVYKCRAWSIYLSSKLEEIVSIALLPSKVGFDLEWWCSSDSDFLRQGTDKDSFASPLFSGKQKLPLIRRYMRGMPVPDPEPGDKFWIDGCPGWEPVDEDGYDDPIWEEVIFDFSLVSEILTWCYSRRIMSRMSRECGDASCVNLPRSGE
ncbi:uncharacterized protein F5891DRAFT_954592 [Suillus fuscotomentosus]|uniref:Uncharacterized protein n=1 Tax=Suillus fuscotomentosus TaxID=1912939 RepID=A0AAD4E3U8_9AGAM|nr:uncharacterized protein F5891DRAFT_954592 [Suillus fuscotomentosus]KAG1899060.1 hypothetical protein F5891DRAFT_954592 [Suillus fuscotomentosus]